MDKKSISPIAWFYLLLALVGLIVPLWNFAESLATVGIVTTGQDLLRGNFKSPAAASMTFNLIVISLAGMVWLFVEAWRLGMRWWGYLFGWLFLPSAFLFPFFLFQRELQLTDLVDGSEAVDDVPDSGPGDTDLSQET